MKQLESTIFVSEQTYPDTLGLLAEQGFSTVVNHRPDGEEPGQPTGDEIAQAARAAGLAYVHAPVRGFPHAGAVVETARALEDAKGRGAVLLFCRSGMRSTAAWALARLGEGADPDALKAAAAAAGYDIAALIDQATR